MSREYARIKVAIWTDLDFRDLTAAAQHLYFMLLTSPSLSLAGVADWRPRRIAAMCSGWTVQDVEAAASELEAARYVLVDEDTEEVLVRSFVRHDRVLLKPNVAASMVKDAGRIASRRLLEAVAVEVARVASETPEAAGVKVAEDLVREGRTILTKGSGNGSPNRSGEGSGNRSGNGSGNGYTKGSGNGSPIPQPSSLSQQTTALSPRSREDAPAKTPRRRSPSVPIPDGWTPTQAHASKAAELGVNLAREAEAFRAHAQAHDRRCVRWDAAFTQWLLKAPAHGGARGPDMPDLVITQPTTPEEQAALTAALFTPQALQDILAEEATRP